MDVWEVSAKSVPRRVVDLLWSHRTTKNREVKQ